MVSNDSVFVFSVFVSCVENNGLYRKLKDSEVSIIIHTNFVPYSLTNFL